MKSRGSLVIVLILLVGVIGALAIVAFGFFDLGKMKLGGKETTVVDAQLEELNEMSTSDEIGDIEEDISGTELDSIDTELEQVDKEIPNL